MKTQVELSQPKGPAVASVAMCTYNGERYLPQQLRSIADQSILPIELVVCDDGSTDATKAILRDFSCSAPFPVRVFENRERLGPTKNFGKAIGLCGGDIIFLCDQDDVWQKEKIARIVDAMERNPDAVYAFSDARVVDDAGVSAGYTLWEALGLLKNFDAFASQQFSMLLRKSLVTGATAAVRASFREILLPIPADWMHDAWIASLGSAIFRGVAVPDVLMSYRRHSAQACGWRSKTFWQVCKTSMSSSAQESAAKVDQVSSLINRIASASVRWPVQDRTFELLREKEEHLLHRAQTRSAGNIAKVGKVVRELMTGRYQRFTESFWYSVIRDLY